MPPLYSAYSTCCFSTLASMRTFSPPHDILLALSLTVTYNLVTLVVFFSHRHVRCHDITVVSVYVFMLV